MATSFPGSQDSFTNPSSGSSLSSPSHAQQHADVNDAVEALQAKVGVDSSTVSSSLDYRVAALEQTSGRRNLLYNGAMQVAQRGTSTTSISNATHQHYTADRYTTTILNSIGTWTNSVVSDAPDGFGKSLKMTCTTAQTSPGSTASAFLSQKLEGQDLQGLAKGTSSAKEVTLSFWVKSNVTGTYAISLYDHDNSGRTVSKQYTISSADTWEKKTITFPADTTGAFDNDNALSLQITIWLAGGSNYTSGTLNETWNSYVAANEAVGQTNLASAVNNYIQFTGVQLELGDKATPFEHRSFGEELALCQRYYQRHVVGGAYFPIAAAMGSTNGLIQYSLPVTMRATPTLTASSGALLRPLSTNGSIVGTTDTTSVAWYSTATPYGGQIYFSGSSGLTAGTAIGVYVNTHGGGWLEFNGAEL